jgi:hypothetical protein
VESQLPHERSLAGGPLSPQPTLPAGLPTVKKEVQNVTVPLWATRVRGMIPRDGGPTVRSAAKPSGAGRRLGRGAVGSRRGILRAAAREHRATFA